MSAFRASYADWKLIRTRQTVQVIFEIPLSDADAAYDVLGGMPNPARETWFGIAPLTPAAKETSKQSPETIPARPQPVTDKLPVAAKRDWRELQPAQQAGIRANDIRFAHFLEEEYPAQWREHQDAAECIRAICQVHSRVELGTNHAKRVLWHSLDTHFDAWMLKERVGA